MTARKSERTLVKVKGIDPAILRRLKAYAVKVGRPADDIVDEALIEWFAPRKSTKKA